MPTISPANRTTEKLVISALRTDESKHRLIHRNDSEKLLPSIPHSSGKGALRNIQHSLVNTSNGKDLHQSLFTKYLYAVYPSSIDGNLLNLLSSMEKIYFIFYGKNLLF